MVPLAGAWVINGVAWPAGVSGDPGGSGVVGVGTCTGCGCGDALGVGSVCCARGSGERTGVLSSFCLSDEGACVVGRAARLVLGVAAPCSMIVGTGLRMGS